MILRTYSPAHQFIYSSIQQLHIQLLHERDYGTEDRRMLLLQEKVYLHKLNLDLYMDVYGIILKRNVH